LLILSSVTAEVDDPSPLLDARSFRSNADKIESILQFHLNFEYGFGAYSAADLLSYGCWCDLENPHRHGKPVDDVDKLCHKHFRCHRCVSMDSSYACSPNVQYELTFDTATQSHFCAASNTDLCEMEACLCDLELITQMVRQAPTYDSYQVIDDYNTPVCESPDSPSFPVDSCCGEYPERFPFSQVSGKGCCNNS